MKKLQGISPLASSHNVIWYNNFEGVDTKLESSLKTMTTYYKSMKLKPNPLKTEVCAFHPKNRLASRNLDITWEGVKLQHTPYPKYLGVHLDRSLDRL